MRRLEGLDPTAEAENDMADVEPATPGRTGERAHANRARGHERAFTPAGEMPAQITPDDLDDVDVDVDDWSETAATRRYARGTDVPPDLTGANAQGAADMQSLTRALRDLEAAKARVERDAARAAQELREKLVVELLPVLDNLDRTIRAAEQANEAPTVVEGVRMVRSQFMSTLQRMGVSRIDSRHQPFDPTVHEAVGTVPVTHPAAHNVVVDQLEPGYRFGDRLLRPAKVVVGRHQPRWH